MRWAVGVNAWCANSKKKTSNKPLALEARTQTKTSIVFATRILFYCFMYFDNKRIKWSFQSFTRLFSAVDMPFEYHLCARHQQNSKLTSVIVSGLCAFIADLFGYCDGLLIVVAMDFLGHLYEPFGHHFAVIHLFNDKLTNEPLSSAGHRIYSPIQISLEHMHEDIFRSVWRANHTNWNTPCHRRLHLRLLCIHSLFRFQVHRVALQPGSIRIQVYFWSITLAKHLDLVLPQISRWLCQKWIELWWLSCCSMQVKRRDCTSWIVLVPSTRAFSLYTNENVD